MQAPTLVIQGNHYACSVERAIEIYRLIPNAEIAIFPGGHGTYLDTFESLIDGHWPLFNAATLIEEFLDK